MSELSTAVQAVLDAVEDDCIHPDDKHRIAAAALRAAADQCINRNWSVEMDELYKEFYVITAELEAQ